MLWIRDCLRELCFFAIKQAWSCLFGGLMLLLVVATKLVWPTSAPLARYDFLTLAALAIQALLLLLKLETFEEAKVILVFHLAGTIMELFKTKVGSWHYPEPSVLRLGDVPLFSGFMYAAVGSYISRSWRILDLRFSDYPDVRLTVGLAAAVYVNFFTHHYVWDLRVLIFAATAALFGRTRVYFRAEKKDRSMPLLLGFLLVALFIWFAENIGTVSHTWTYPHQTAAWHMVPISKLGAWYLLMIVSFVLVSLVHRPALAARLTTTAVHDEEVVAGRTR